MRLSSLLTSTARWGRAGFALGALARGRVDDHARVADAERLVQRARQVGDAFDTPEGLNGVGYLRYQCPL